MRISTLFNDRQFYRSLFAIALPIMFQNFINSAVNMLDTVMIGRLGTVEIAAVGLGNQVFFLYNLALFGLCSGASIFTAQFWGKRDIAGIRKNTGFCLILALSGASLVTLAASLVPGKIIGVYSRDPAVIAAGSEYLRMLAPSFIPFGVSMVFTLTLRSVEKVRLAMTSTLIALTINAVLNYCLIFGAGPFPAMGVRGAAAATVAARIIEMLILLCASYINKYPPAGSLRELLGFRSSYIRRFIRIVLPVLINEITWSAGVSLQNLIFARTHTDAIAAFNIANTVNQLTWVLFIGLGNGVAVLIGKKIGEGDEAKARGYASRIVRFAPMISVGAAGVLLGISRFLPLVFNVNENVIASVRVMFIILCAMYPFRAFNMSMVVGICRAGGDTIFCVIYDVIFMWTIALPLAALAGFYFKAPVWALFLCLSSEECFKVLLGIWRLRTGKWLRNVTGGM
ncbi:MAG: MATE family efflux transporter [Treponema sp.]|jgi:putative MATE family efflux protein|nr:MATE family efflux transporter [Treponema sp.]